MKRALKQYFIPHAENCFQPHILHTKRAFFYSAVFLTFKLILVIFVLALPLEVFVTPDILLAEQKKILALTNELRVQKGLKPLVEKSKLDTSAQNKVDDMAKYSYFSHTSPKNKTVSDWLRASGYSYRVAGENLAMGFSTADEVVSAWIKSPTHYANLIDSDYLEFGSGIQSGYYDGVATAYVAEHFGTAAAALAPVVKPVSVASVTTKKTVVKTLAIAKSPVRPPEVVLAEKDVAPLSTQVVYDGTSSKVYWLEENGQTKILVRAYIVGPVKMAVATVGSYPVELLAAGNGFFEGRLTVNETADTFFKVIISPTIKITARDGQITLGQIDWYNFKVVSPSPWDTYFHAKTTLGSITNIFSVSRMVYLVAIVFFAIALLLSILIDIKKQNYHIILQTLALVGLLIILFII